MRRVWLVSQVCAVALFGAELGSIGVGMERVVMPSELGTNPLKEKFAVKEKGIELFGDKAKTSPYKALDLKPDIIVETQDGYGLGSVDARFRGVDSNFMALSFEGVPNYSIRPIGPRQGIYDMENIESIEHFGGALNPDTGSGVGSKAGITNLVLKKPSDKPKAELSLSGGGDDFYKAYLRGDSGVLGDAFKSFASYSNANAKKWKGSGDLGVRENITLGTALLNEVIPLEIFYSGSEHKKHNFKPLSYAEIQDLDKNYDNDYQSTNKNALNYYDYWRSDSTYNDTLASLKKECFGAGCSFKIYGSDYDELSQEGDGEGHVDAKRVGFMASARKKFDGFGLEAGIWGERSWLNKYVKKVSLDQNRSVQGWKWLNKNGGPTELISPYLSATTAFNKLKLEGGMRYLYYKESSNDTYLGNNKNADYDTAIDKGTIAPGGSVDAMKYHLWLPTIGARYELDETFELYGKWGKGYQRPYRYSFAAQYGANANGLRDKLLAKGKNLQSIVESWKMETSDLFDIGVRKYLNSGELSLGLFYNIHQNLLSSAYDPDIGINYLQNIGEAAMYGVQATSSIEPTKGVWFYLNPAITYSEVKKDIKYANKNYSLKGNETPETPRVTVKAGTTFEYEKHLFVLSGRYIGERYADIENKQKIDGYETVDFSYNYKIKNFTPFKELNMQFAISNIFDKKYVSSIGSADILEDTPSFYVGAPRSYTLTFRSQF